MSWEQQHAAISRVPATLCGPGGIWAMLTSVGTCQMTKPIHMWWSNMSKYFYWKCLFFLNKCRSSWVTHITRGYIDFNTFTKSFGTVAWTISICPSVFLCVDQTSILSPTVANTVDILEGISRNSTLGRFLPHENFHLSLNKDWLWLKRPDPGPIFQNVWAISVILAIHRNAQSLSKPCFFFSLKQPRFPKCCRVELRAAVSWALFTCYFLELHFICSCLPDSTAHFIPQPCAGEWQPRHKASLRWSLSSQVLNVSPGNPNSLSFPRWNCTGFGFQREL